MNFFTKIFGTKNDKIIKGLRPLVDKINSFEPSLQKLSDDQLAAKTGMFKERLANGESLQSILPEAFAVCREGAHRTLGHRHYDVQMIGGIVLNQGKIAEMKTGEGKTLTATLPCYLHGIAGKGAHVVTVNDYLAKRDSEWMGQVYKFLGLSCGNIGHGLSDAERKEAYACDITYGTNNEFGFDYLRDNMKTNPDWLVQRGHSFAIVDEVDSILIDEARTPLIISGQADTNIEIYGTVNAVIPGLQKDSDYVLDEKSRVVSLTEDGISKLEARLRIDNLYNPNNIEWLHHCQVALKAHVMFKKDVDYVVKNGEIIIIDEFTGRLMAGRRYSDGLHGALEAKEHVQVQQESQTMATITFQNYFRLYSTLSGMTGTADTEAVEFKNIYNLDVVVVPTNRKVVRKDEDDVIFATATEKYKAISEDIADAQKRGQPVLVGTVSVEKSELLANLLKKKNIPHSILNAKNHASEASIIENSGKKGHVTIATNMAGRGTDIKLGEGVKDVGGLYVIGTERHESRRIDNQLRGRSGRQGDPGMSKFFLSFEDDLMRIFASDRLGTIMSKLGLKDGEAIISPMVSSAIEKAQKRVEQQNFSSRKHVLEYDDVMSQQRQVVYKKRRLSLLGEFKIDFLAETIEDLTASVVERLSPEMTNSDQWKLDEIRDEIQKQLDQQVDLSSLDPLETNVDSIVNLATDQIQTAYEKKLSSVSEDIRTKIESYVYLQVIDRAWKDHLLAMDSLKDSVSLRGYAQRDPLQEYKKEAFNLFSMMMGRVSVDTIQALIHMPEPEFNVNAEAGLGDSEEHEEIDPSLIFGERPPKKQDDEKLIYHGSRSSSSDDKIKNPVRRGSEKVGRNSPCPCGSGKKYKKCCGAINK